MNSKPQRRVTETPEDRFKRLAESRVNNVLRSIRILGNLSNTTNYSYKPDQVQRIFEAVREQLDLVEGKFEIGARNSGRSRFKF
jgi:hypothetical protein